MTLRAPAGAPPRESVELRTLLDFIIRINAPRKTVYEATF
jgi:hypothetical protein